MNLQNHEQVILFDGVCNLCSRAVQFVIKRDKKKRFHFASLQSAFGAEVLKQFNLPANDLNSFILLENNQVYTRSTGALKVSKQLNGLWPILYVFIIVPKFIRDAVYRFIANNRYKWFGKKEACWVPTRVLRERFISE